MVILSVITFVVMLRFKPSYSTGFSLVLFFLSSWLFTFFLNLTVFTLPTIELLAAVTVTYYLTLPFKAISENRKAATLERESKMRKEVEELKNNL